MLTITQVRCDCGALLSLDSPGPVAIVKCDACLDEFHVGINSLSRRTFRAAVAAVSHHDPALVIAGRTAVDTIDTLTHSPKYRASRARSIRGKPFREGIDT